MAFPDPSPQAIIDAGEEIYTRLFKSEYRQTNIGKFVAIDVDSETPYLAETPAAALGAGLSACPHGRFHVIYVE
ncbi:MAG TPA: hypothetical protein VNE83_00130 [Terriglobales bacterium]|nr:hypothetical protein [Terriglobales bacterium]